MTDVLGVAQECYATEFLCLILDDDDRIGKFCEVTVTIGFRSIRGGKSW